MSSQLESLSKWVQLKIYQFEVTLSVYIWTPIEKFFFYSLLFLLFSLTFIATTLYLPQHLQFIFSRAWFYMHGDSTEGLVEAVKGAGHTIANTALGAAAKAKGVAAATEAASGMLREL